MSVLCCGRGKKRGIAENPSRAISEANTVIRVMSVMKGKEKITILSKTVYNAQTYPK